MFSRNVRLDDTLKEEAYGQHKPHEAARAYAHRGCTSKGIRSSGPYRRAKLKQWLNFLANKRSDEVIKDDILVNALNRQGYFPKFNPASYFDINQMWEALYDYDKGFNADADFFYKDEHFNKAIKVALKVFGRKGEYLKPLESEVELYSSIRLTSSAGLPSLDKKDVAFPTSYMRFKDVKKGLKAFNPCLAQFRTQRKIVNGVPIGKTRNVFAYPLDATIYESQYFYPLQAKLMKLRTCYPAGLWRMEMGARLSSTLRNKFVYEIDYSRFDSSVPLGLIRICFHIIKTWYEDKYHEEIDKIFQYFVNTPIVMPDGKLYIGKSKGVPSGSCFTQLVDTMCNMILTFAIGSRFGLRLSWYATHFVGDDGIFSSDKKVSMDKIANYAGKFGFTINPGKSKVVIRENYSPHFVGFNFDRGLPTKPIDEVISSLSYPERYRKLPTKEMHDIEMFRQIGLLSLDSTRLLRNRINAYNRGDFIECLGIGKYSGVTSGSGYIQYRERYLDPKDRPRYRMLSGDFLR